MVSKLEVNDDELAEDDSTALVDDGEGGLEEDLCGDDPNLDAMSLRDPPQQAGGDGSPAGGTGAEEEEEDEEEDLT